MVLYSCKYERKGICLLGQIGLRRMKLKRIFALALTMLMVLLACASCSGKSYDETVMSYNGVEIKGYMYKYWLSTNKSYYVSPEDDNPEYWAQSLGDGMTYESYLKGIIDNSVKTNAILLSLFDEYQLTLTDEQKAEAEGFADDYLAAFGGDEKALNEKLAVYGLDYTKFKEVKVLEAKIQMVYDYLFGAEGKEAVTDEDLIAYYKNNYSRVKILIVNNVFEYVKDENGSVVYDASTGEAQTKLLDDAKKTEKNNLAADIEKKINAGEDFEALLAAHNDDIDAVYYPNGYYICPNDFAKFGADITNAAKELAVGGTKKIEDETGIYFIKKYDLIENGFADATDAEQFANLYSYCLADAINGFTESYLANVTVDEKALSKYSLADASVSGK